MKVFKVYGSGCPKCRKTAEMIQEEADRRGEKISLEKIFDPAEVAKVGLMKMPGVNLDGKFIHVGGVPSTKAVASWFV